MTDNNSNIIIKAFENHPIFIFNEKVNSKNQYYFKALDIGKALDITNMSTSIQNFDEDERVLRETYDTIGRIQNTIFLTSHGIYRLLYGSKKPIAKQFRKWASTILDDIIFNNSEELLKKLEESNNNNKIIEEQHKKDLLEKDNEKNWLHKITKNQISFKKFLTKTDGIYLGSATFEHQNYIEKIGKSINSKQREDRYKTSRVKENTFQIYKNYDIFNGMESVTEKYVHGLLNPFHINNSTIGGTEHFMVHQSFASKIINKVIIDQNETIDIINNYIDLLSSNDYNYDTVLPLLDNNIIKNIVEKKICISCDQILEIYNFFLIDKINNTRNKKCNTCVTNYSNNLKQEMLLDPLNGKKQCTKCNDVYNFDMFFIDKNNIELLWDFCKKCNNELVNNPTKQCISCYSVLTYNNFGKSIHLKDGFKNKCKICFSVESIKVICEFCNFQILELSLNKHQNSASCKVYQDKNNEIENNIEIINSNSIEKIISINTTEEIEEINEIIKLIDCVGVDDENTLKKQCTRCKEILTINNFFIHNKLKQTHRAECRSCHSKISKELSKKIKENPIHGKKECMTCKNVYDNYLFFKKSSDESDQFLDDCIDCYNKNVSESHRQCGTCYKIKPLYMFASDKSKLGNRSSGCKECKKIHDKNTRTGLTLKVCEICNNKVSATNFLAHKKTKRCMLIASIKEDLHNNIII